MGHSHTPPIPIKGWAKNTLITALLSRVGGGNDLCPFPPTIAYQFPSGSGMSMTMITLLHLPRRERQGCSSLFGFRPRFLALLASTLPPS